MCLAFVERDEAGLHGARKPKELYHKLMKLACLPNSNILDPCCGSGVVFPAAKEAGMIAWGVEVDEETYKLARVSLDEGEETDEQV